MMGTDIKTVDYIDVYGKRVQHMRVADIKTVDYIDAYGKTAQCNSFWEIGSEAHIKPEPKVETNFAKNNFVMYATNATLKFNALIHSVQLYVVYLKPEF